MKNVKIIPIHTYFDGIAYPTITTNEEMGEFVTAMRLYLTKYPEEDIEKHWKRR